MHVQTLVVGIRPSADTAERNNIRIRSAENMPTGGQMFFVTCSIFEIYIARRTARFFVHIYNTEVLVLYVYTINI